MDPKENDKFDMTMIDFDNAQKSWYIVDPGTVVFNANTRMFLTAPVQRSRKIKQMKTWWLDEYGFDTTEAELQQGC
jgi:hypothetical protein